MASNSNKDREAAFFAAQSGVSVEDKKLTYYRAQAGLPTASLDTARLAYFKANSGLASGSVTDHEVKFLQTQTTATHNNLTLLRQTYYG